MVTTPILGITELAPTQQDKATTLNDALLAIENATQDTLSVDFSGGNVTLSAGNYTSHLVFHCHGQTASRTLTVPLTKRDFLVDNTVGGFAITVGGSTGATVVVAAAAMLRIYCDGTDCKTLSATGSGTGTVTSVAVSGGSTGLTTSGGPVTTTGTITLAGTLAVANGGTGLTSGTSGGILGYTASGTLASSGALPNHAILLGGGAGATPTALGSLGTSTTVLHGAAAGAPTFGPVSLTADVSGTLPFANGGAGSRAVAMLKEWAGGATVGNDTFHFVFNAPWAGTVDSLDYFTGAGSFTVAVQINGTNVTGLSAVSVSSATPANASASAANTFTAGQKITAVVTGATGSPIDALLQLNCTRTS